MGLTVAVTGPTGEIGISAVTALEQDPTVDRIIVMARRPFEPDSHGWTKTTYHQGDILDREAVDALVADADVVIHLAFIVLGSRAEGERVNLAGTRTVFEAAVAAERVKRLVYTSSVAAYGYYSDNPVPLTEDVPPRGSPEHAYSEQKAACEAALAEITEGSSLEVFVLRPCIVAGPKATALADAMPWNRFPSPIQSITRAIPILKLPFPDPGFPLQLVHHDDVAAAIALAAVTSAPPGGVQHRRRRRDNAVGGHGGPGRAPGTGSGRHRYPRVGGGSPIAVPSLHRRLGARGTNVSRDGYRQSQDAAWLDPQVHGCANPGGTGSGRLSRRDNGASALLCHPGAW
jgi:nucleoside-diphosphate-sugar epimerase